jgi:hypothetical protein
MVEDPEPPPRKRWYRWRRVLRGLAWTGVVRASVLPVLVAATWLWWLGDPPADQHSRGVNAVWAGHRWVGQAHSEQEYAELVRHLDQAGISDVFFHVGPLDAAGTVPPDRYAHARELLAAMHRLAPGVRVEAYLGQVDRHGGGPLDLDDAEVRQRIVQTAAGLLDLGFGGIHYDIEPIYPGDRSFLDLLARTHDLTQPRGAVLSVSMEQLELVPGAQAVVSRLVRRYHDATRTYLRAVAARVDQLAIMTYDTGLPADWLYGWFTAWQTEQVVRLVGDRVTVFIGVPTYMQGQPLGFHPSAENLRSGLRGVRKGLARMDPTATRRVGVALFAEWTTSQDEWRACRNEWVQPVSKGQ